MKHRCLPVLLLFCAACSSGTGTSDVVTPFADSGIPADASGDTGPRTDGSGPVEDARFDLSPDGRWPDATGTEVDPAGDAGGLEIKDGDTFEPADFAIAIEQPEEFSVQTGAIKVYIAPVDMEELKLDGLAVSINGEAVFFDTKLPTSFVLDTTQYQEAGLDIKAQANIANKAATDLVSVPLENPSFHFKYVSVNEYRYKNGDEVSIYVSTGKAGMDLSADFSAMDSTFAPGEEQAYEIGGGKYMLHYLLSKDNQNSDGRYLVPITAGDGEFILTYTHLALALENQESLPVRLEGGIFVDGSLPEPDDGWSQPIGGFTGNDFIINGGSAKINADFSGYAYPEEIIGIIVGVDGYAGYFQKPLSGSPGVEELLLLLRVFVESEEPPAKLNIKVAVKDVTGRVSPYKSHQMEVQTVGSGDVQVSISWDTPTDVDLHVIDPENNELWYGDTFSSSGGELDLDSNPACVLDGVNNENVFWAPGQAPLGTYIVRVDFYMDCPEYCGGGYCGAKYTVTTNYCGLTEVFDGSFAPGQDDQGGEGDGVTVTTFSNENCARVLRGKVRYEDKTFDEFGFSAAGWRPIRYATVEVRRAADGELLAGGSTDRFGNYEIQFSNKGDPGVYIEVRCQTDFEEKLRLITVMNHPKFNKVYAVASPSTDETESDAPVIDFDIPEMVSGGAFNILDMAVDGYDLIRLMTGKDLGELRIYWATGADTTDTLYCSEYFYSQGVCSEMGALSVQGKDSDRDEYDDMVILKEFFKFALEQVSRDDNPGGYHDGTRDDALRAWSEGVSSFFASDVLHLRHFVNSRPQGVYIVEDLEVMDTPFAFGTETGTMFGPLSEHLVSALLWDLVDGGMEEAFDAVENRIAVYDSIFNYLPSSKFVDRGPDGVDLVDFLDGWVCRGWEEQEGLESLVVQHRDFPYDFSGPASCVH